jgi:hypothetical protein
MPVPTHVRAATPWAREAVRMFEGFIYQRSFTALTDGNVPPAFALSVALPLRRTSQNRFLGER